MSYDLLSLSPDMTEKRTTFRGVSSDDAESSSDSVAALAFFLVGNSNRIPRCSFDENVFCAMGLAFDTLRFERGVDGAVEVRVDSDAFESEGVRGLECDDAEGGFFMEERAGGGGREIVGAEPLLTCEGRVGRGGVETPSGVSGVSGSRVRL